MALREMRGGSLALLVWLLSLVVWAQSLALAIEHQEHHSPDHCCVICHSGPLPFVQISVAAGPTPVLPVAWFASPAEFHDTHDVLTPASSSRAPPA
jgi:hypothetical protein